MVCSSAYFLLEIGKTKTTQVSKDPSIYISLTPPNNNKNCNLHLCILIICCSIDLTTIFSRKITENYFFLYNKLRKNYTFEVKYLRYDAKYFPVSQPNMIKIN